MNKKMTTLSILITLLAHLAFADATISRNDSITFETLLQELIDRSVVAEQPGTPYRLLRASSYERKSVGKDAECWYANEDWSNYVRKEVVNGKEEYVLMDQDGPGAITRFGTGGHPNQKNHLCIYIDGNEAPVWEADTTGKLIGQNAEIGYPLSYRSIDQDLLGSGAQPGHNLSAPIPFQEHMKITSDCPKGGPDTGFWYNINYRLYQDGVAVESFAKETPVRYKAKLNHVNDVLSDYMKLAPKDVRVPDEKESLVFDYSIKAQEIKSFSVSEPGSIRRILLSLKAADMDEAVKNLWIHIEFDGVTTVKVPAGFFFGCGDQLLTVSDWYRKVDTNGNMACFWVMPYQKSAVVHLINQGNETVSGSLEIARGEYAWNDRSMYFHAAFNRLEEMPAKTAKDFNYVDLQGQAGTYVGDVLQVYKSFRGWWGEGDEKIYVDGSAFPDHFGTGTEDYYGYAWGHSEPFNQIFTTQPVGNANTGQSSVTVNSRVRSLDAIPFNRSFRVDMESWQSLGGAVNYSVACF
jgi:hypothetical protein